VTETKILVVDDDDSHRYYLTEALKKLEYSITGVPGALDALNRIKNNQFDAVLMDIEMPGMNGIQALAEIKEIDPYLPVVMITAYGYDDAVPDIIKYGAQDQLTKGNCSATELRIVVKRAVEKRRLYEQASLLKIKGEVKETCLAPIEPPSLVAARLSPATNIVGRSQKIQEIFELIEKVLDNDLTVLIHGESGTGKELIARAIHQNSLRADKPFQAINCAAIPENLMESELFGHEKGAFTNAVAKRVGKFELANTGTLFLDEVGDMNPIHQAKLLRVLQEGEFESVGGPKAIKVDVRIIAATNKDLEDAVQEGTFREDLYYRLNVFPIFVPSLRERKEDIPLLVEYFLEITRTKLKKNVTGISDDALRFLMKQSWPGNVRELENALYRAAAYAGEGILKQQHFSQIQTSSAKPKNTEHKSLQGQVDEVSSSVEREIILDALEKANWKRTQAAKLLGISRKSLYNKMNKYDITEVA